MIEHVSFLALYLLTSPTTLSHAARAFALQFPVPPQKKPTIFTACNYLSQAMAIILLMVLK